MIRRLSVSTRSGAAGGLLVFCCGLAAAANDPTRPPDVAIAPAAAASAAPRSGAPASSAAAAPPPVLQSLRLQPDGTASALVNGQLLRVGDAWSGRSVVAIDADGIVLRGSGPQVRLSWAPGVTKSAPANASPDGEPRGRRLPQPRQPAPDLPSLQPPVLAVGSDPR